MEDRIYVVYEPDWGVEKLTANCKQIHKQSGGLGGVFVDYLGLVTPPEGTYHDRSTEIIMVARWLKRLAVAIDCPVLTAAQIDAEVAKLAELLPPGTLEDHAVLEAIAKRRPQLHYLGAGGGGAQEADLVLGLLNYQADFYASRREAGMADRDLQKETGSAGPFEVGVMKNRHGTLSSAALVLEAHTGFLRDPGVFGR